MTIENLDFVYGLNISGYLFVSAGKTKCKADQSEEFAISPFDDRNIEELKEFCIVYTV